MFLERVLDMVEGLVGYFYACVNCGKREDAEEGVRYLCEERPSRILSTEADHQIRNSPCGLLEENRKLVQEDGIWTMKKRRTLHWHLKALQLRRSSWAIYGAIWQTTPPNYDRSSNYGISPKTYQATLKGPLCRGEP